MDVVNQYTTVGGTSRTHDNNGNLTDDGTYLFGYDFQNRLVELKNKSTSAVIATYRYDALGRRVEKAVVGGATTRYILDGVQVVEEYDGSNVWQALYVYEDGIDRPRCMDRRRHRGRERELEHDGDLALPLPPAGARVRDRDHAADGRGRRVGHLRRLRAADDPGHQRERRHAERGGESVSLHGARVRPGVGALLLSGADLRSGDGEVLAEGSVGPDN